MERNDVRESWEEREISVSLQVPDPAWKIAIFEIHVVDDELWVLSRVSRDPEVLAPQVISETSDRVEVSAPELPVKHYILGKTWGWSRDVPEVEPIFLDDRTAIEDGLNRGRKIFDSDEVSSEEDG